MIPASLLGLAVFAATAAPGRVFERRVEQRAPRPARSTAAEVVELVVLGELFTLLALLLVSFIAQITGWVDVGALIDEPQSYASDETARIILAAFAVLVLSHVVADTTARKLYPKIPAQDADRLGGFAATSAWHQHFWTNRPSKTHGSTALVVLANGVGISGEVATFTADPNAENRELVLRPPIFIRGSSGGGSVEFTGDFVLIREDQISFIAGRYVEGSSA